MSGGKLEGLTVFTLSKNSGLGKVHGRGGDDGGRSKSSSKLMPMAVAEEIGGETGGEHQWREGNP